MKDCIPWDWLSAIQDARKGLLSPHWQQAYLEEISSFNCTQTRQKLLSLLSDAICSRPQISDEEDARRELTQGGLQLLFFFERDYKTMAELTFCPQQNSYTFYLALDQFQVPIQLNQDVQLIASKLDAWCDKAGIIVDKENLPPFFPSDLGSYSFPSLLDAIYALYALLYQFYS